MSWGPDFDYSNKSTHHLASSYISYSATSRLTSGVAFTDLHERTNDASEPEKKLGLEIACNNRQDSVGARGAKFEWQTDRQTGRYFVPDRVDARQHLDFRRNGAWRGGFQWRGDVQQRGIKEDLIETIRNWSPWRLLECCRKHQDLIDQPAFNSNKSLICTSLDQKVKCGSFINQTMKVRSARCLRSKSRSSCRSTHLLSLTRRIRGNYSLTYPA